MVWPKSGGTFKSKSLRHKGAVLVSSGFHSHFHRLDTLKVWNCVLSQSRGADVRNPVVLGLIPSGDSEGEMAQASSLLLGLTPNLWCSLACRWVTSTPTSLFTQPSLCLSALSGSDWDVLIGFRAHSNSV